MLLAPPAPVGFGAGIEVKAAWQANYRADTNFLAFDVSPTPGFHPAYYDGVEPYTSPVGSFAANGYGLYDMAGNVWQRCWDWLDDGYYGSSPGIDPRGPATGSYRVNRGGSCYNYGGDSRSAYRLGYYGQDMADPLVGFRTVLPPSQP